MRTEAQKAARRRYESSYEFKLRKRAYNLKWRRSRGIRPLKSLKQEYVARLHNPKSRAKTRLKALALKQKHWAALVWSLRAPSGKVFRFKNLPSFIRDHKDLFSHEELLPVNKLGRTRIEASISLLSPRRKYPSTVAHGWTWFLGDVK